LELAAKSDPSILLAVQQLKAQIPSLAKNLVESHPHLGHSEAGSARGYIRNGEFRVRSRSLDDGSIIQPTDDASKSVATILKKAGFEQSPIAEAVATLQNAPENLPLEIAPGLIVAKWTVDRVELDLSKSQIMNPLIPVKMAFEFLACHVGEAIYDKGPQLAEIRRAMCTMEFGSKTIMVERLTSNKYQSFHGLCFEGNDPYAIVLIRLFGWLAYRVHFLKLSIGGPRFVYTHYIDTSEERVALCES
jgi:hypothetical protein